MEGSSSTSYVENRISQYRGWYDAKARRCKNAYLSLRGLALVAATLLPTSAVLPHLAPWVAIALSCTVLLALGLEMLLRLRQQWENYRYTEQYLDRERHLFAHGAGAYRGLSRDSAFVLLVERVEWAISAENSTTMATMSLSPDSGVRGSAP